MTTPSPSGLMLWPAAVPLPASKTDPGCPPVADGQPSDPVSGLGCSVSDLGSWAEQAPGRLAHLAAVWWPWLAAGALAAVVAALLVRAVHRRLWRRAVGTGYWVQLTPPRTLDLGQAGNVWKLLGPLARRARGGWHLARPPLAFEVYASGGQLVAGLWLPGWVPLPMVVAEVARAWPGVRTERRRPPAVTGSDGWRVAAFRLAAIGSDLVPLTDEHRPAGRAVRGPGADVDPLRAVLAGLARPDGPAVLQVLVRPAAGKQLAALGHAARYRVKPRKPVGVRLVDGIAAVAFGAVRLLLDVVLDLVSTNRSSSSHGGGYGGRDARLPTDPLAVRAIRDAAEKMAEGPHLLATVRVGVGRVDAGFATTAARSLADGFVTVSRLLRPVRVRRAAVALADRWAGRGDWHGGGERVAGDRRERSRHGGVGQMPCGVQVGDEVLSSLPVAGVGEGHGVSRYSAIAAAMGSPVSASIQAHWPPGFTSRNT